MKQDKRRGLTRIALALALAGYCVAPVALAEDSAWVDSGETNMFDLATVQRLAFERDFYELVLFIEEHRKEYIRFILTGHEE